jgi:hypothetical protein
MFEIVKSTKKTSVFSLIALEKKNLDTLPKLIESSIVSEKTSSSLPTRVQHNTILEII